ncbi:MAG: Gfo/Idh/MocA family oxidoreductase [Burkholderiales bacterium]
MTAWPLRIVVAGAGVIGRRHVELVGGSGECALAAIVDPAPAAAAVAAAHGVPCFASLAGSLAHTRPDGVILATPNALHVIQALECIAAGVPVLVEKPVAHSVAEGERLAAAVDRVGARLLVGHHRAHSPILAAARAVVAAGTIGRIVAVSGSALFRKPPAYFAEAPWRTQAGGGPILINLIHEIGNLRSLCGGIAAVHAVASSAIRGHAVEDTVAITLRFASGALGNFLLSDAAASGRSWEQTARENAAYATYPDEDCYVIAGTRGSLSVPTMRLKVHAPDAEPSWFTPMAATTMPLARADPLERQLAHFCAVIRGEQAPLVSVHDGLANLRVTEAIAESARTGKIVAIEAQE